MRYILYSEKLKSFLGKNNNKVTSQSEAQIFTSIGEAIKKSIELNSQYKVFNIS